MSKFTTEAGPIQTKRVVAAHSKLMSHGRSWLEITDHGEHRLNSPFSPPSDVVVKVAHAIGEAVQWKITAANHQQLVASFETAAKAIPLPVVDKRTTPEQRAEREKNNQLREEKDAKERAELKAVVDKLVAELRARYPWAKGADSGLSSHARAAANMREQLRLAFPGIKFSVKSECYSGGDSVKVRWALGPTTDEVNALVSQYREGTFDGMDDSYKYDRTPEFRAHEIVLGGTRYTSTDREYPAQWHNLVRDAIMTLNGVPQPESDRYWDVQVNGYSLEAMTRAAFEATSLPPGAEVTGVVEREEGDCLRRYRVTFNAVAIPAEATETGHSWHIQKHYHTKKMRDMWMVILDAKVDEHTFNVLREKCKTMCGWYSRAWGKTPGGFAFWSEDEAKAFGAKV